MRTSDGQRAHHAVQRADVQRKELPCGRVDTALVSPQSLDPMAQSHAMLDATYYFMHLLMLITQRVLLLTFQVGPFRWTDSKHISY